MIANVPGQGFDTIYNVGLIGAHVGYQRQFGILVLGLEAGVTAPIGSTGNPTKVVCPRTTIALFSCRSHISEILITAGARAGLSFGDWLPYAAGGYAHTHLDGGFDNLTLAPVGFPIAWWRAPADGWYVGGGFEWRFASSFSLGVEYRHYDFGTRPAAARAIIGGVEGNLTNDNTLNRITADTVTVRLSFLLGDIQRR
jgi:outer membrane immunogenic protein